MDGNHTLERCAAVTEEVLHAVFDQLHEQRVLLEGMLLKPNMVLPGADCAEPVSTEDIADASVACFLRRSCPRRCPASPFSPAASRPSSPRHASTR